MGVIQQMLMGEAAAVVYSTWNPSDKTSSITLSNGNLTATPTGGTQGIRGQLAQSAGKYYFEVLFGTTTGYSYIGISTSGWAETNVLGTIDALSAGYGNSALRANSGSTNIAATGISNGDVVGVAVDITNHKIYWSHNGVWQNSAVPASGTGYVDYITASPVFPAAYFASYNSKSITLNVGATSFTYTPPTGFSAWQ